MNKNNEKIEERLGKLGARLAGQPSVVDRVMDRVDRAEPARISRFNQRRILAMLLKPQSLVAAAAVLALVVFGLRPWSTTENGSAAWWLAPPSAWAGELQASIEKAGQQGFSWHEKFINLLPDERRATSSSTSTFFTAGNRYRRDNYEQGQLRESQWYVQAADGLTMTSVRYNDKTYTVTHDPKARGELDEMRRIEALAPILNKSGRRIGTQRIEGREAVEFEIEASKLEPGSANSDQMLHVWLDQATKMPLKISFQFQSGTILAGTIMVMEEFDWHATLPSGTFEPVIPPGFTKMENE